MFSHPTTLHKYEWKAQDIQQKLEETLAKMEKETLQKYMGITSLATSKFLENALNAKSKHISVLEKERSNTANSKRHI